MKVTKFGVKFSVMSKFLTQISLILTLHCGNTIANESKLSLNASMPSFSPFSSFDENKTCKATISELLTRILTKSNIRFNLVNYPYARILHSLETGTLDSALIFKNTSISQSVEYIGPVSKSEVIILSSAQNSINSYQALSKLRAIAVIRNAHFINKFDNDKTLNKVNVDSYKQAMTMLKFNHVDAIIGSRVGLEYAMQQLDMKQELLSNAFILGTKEWWLHLSKKSPYLKYKNEISLAIKHFYKDDLVYQLYKSQLSKCLAKSNTIQ